MRTPFLSLLTAALVGASLSHPFGARAQVCDLVTNGNFENRTFKNISGNIANVLRPSVPNSLNELPNWESPNDNTPDYYSMGASTAPSQSSNPTVAPFGPFVPIGEASLGILALQHVDNAWYYSEYVTQPLAGGALAPGKYYASMKVISASGGKFATNVGLNITENAPGNWGHYTPGSGDRGIYSTGGLAGTAWKEVRGSFDVVSGTNLRYLTVGNFEDPAAFTYDTARASAPWSYAYVYIDDVQLFKVPTAGPTQYCPATPYPSNIPINVLLGDPCGVPGNFSYAWYKGNGTASPVIGSSYQLLTALPPATSDYTLVVTLPDGTTYTTYTTVYVCPTSPRMAYPNPAAEELTVEAGAQDAQLLNSQGKVVQRADAAGKLDVSRLPAGLYQLQTRQNGKLVNQRIEVKH